MALGPAKLVNYKRGQMQIVVQIIVFLQIPTYICVYIYKYAGGNLHLTIRWPLKIGKGANLKKPLKLE